jgi:amidase
VSPAERCGIVGFKPTKDFIPSEGIIYASQRQDTVGLLTHSVEDAVDILLEIITHAGRDPSDRYRDQSDQDPTPGADCFESGDLKGLRIGAPNLSSFGLHECKIEDFINALLHLEKAGATLAHGVVIAGAEEHKALPQASKDIIQDTDLKLATNTYLSSLKTNPQNIKGLHDIIDFTKHCKAEEYPQRNVAVLERAQATDPEDGLYKKILTKDAYFTGEGGLAAALDRHNVDVLLVPSLSVTHQVFAAKAGSPVISVPMGYYPEGTGVERDPKNGFVTVAPGIP